MTKYLGLPLSLNKLPKSQIHTIADKITSILLRWKAELMNRVCHAIHIQHVMTAKVMIEGFLMERKERDKWGTLSLDVAQGNTAQRAWRFENSSPSKFELGLESKMTLVAKDGVQQTLGSFLDLD
jgi:hypothetical protein